MSKYLLLVFSLILISSGSQAQEKLRVFTWDGYVTAQDISAVNKLLEKAGNPVRAEIIKEVAEGPEQMFQVIRAGKADVSFLTLNYIKMQNEKVAKLLQPVNVAKIPNYAKTIPALRSIPMGLDSSAKPLYVPWGGGNYGIWANMKKLKATELPTSYLDLLDPKWKGKISLTEGQIQPNIAIALLAKGQAPFAIHDLIEAGKREDAAKLAAPNGEVQKYLNGLYAQSGGFWGAAPTFEDNQWLVASYGIEIAGLRAKGQDWQLVKFKEGNTAWLDTINIMDGVTGKKLEAAEIFIDYFLGKEVQTRVVNELSMVAASTDVKNPLIEANPQFFDPKAFWPPYSAQADNLMKKMSDDAKKAK